jgi:hypothetical protein
LRIVVLAGAAAARHDATLAMSRALPRERYEVAFAGIGARPYAFGFSGFRLARRHGDSASPGTTSRRSAALDPDVLIDLAGLEAEVGPLLAQRPARAMVSLSDLGSRNVAPLIDDEVRAAALEDWLQERWHALPSADDVPRAPAMAALWTDAVRAHQRADLHDARAKYGQVLELQPGYAPGHYLLGVVLRDSGDPASARQSFAAAVAAAPAFVDARAASPRSHRRWRRRAPGGLHRGLALVAAPLPLHRAGARTACRQ